MNINRTNDNKTIEYSAHYAIASLVFLNDQQHHSKWNEYYLASFSTNLVTFSELK